MHHQLSFLWLLRISDSPERNTYIVVIFLLACRGNICTCQPQVSMEDLPLLPHMYAPLQLMFAEHCVGLELKAANRAKRAKRSPSSSGTVRSFSTATNLHGADVTDSPIDDTRTTNTVQMDTKDRVDSNLDDKIQSVTQRTNEHCKIDADVSCS